MFSHNETLECISLWPCIVVYCLDREANQNGMPFVDRHQNRLKKAYCLSLSNMSNLITSRQNWPRWLQKTMQSRLCSHFTYIRASMAPWNQALGHYSWPMVARNHKITPPNLGVVIVRNKGKWLIGEQIYTDYVEKRFSLIRSYR